MLNIKDQVVRLKWSSLGSYALAGGKLAMAITSFSIFLGMNAFYTAVIGYGKHQSVIGMNDKKERGELWYYRRIGLLILVSSILYIIYTLRLFITDENISYDNISAISIASVTFLEIGISIYGIISARRKRSILMKALKLLNLSSSFIGLVLTQTAILSFTSSQDHTVANAISGLMFGSITMLIGVWMMVQKNPVPKEDLSDSDKSKE